MVEQIRSFIAIALDKEAISALRQVQDDLRRKPGGQAGKWVQPESIHLTLKFLGDVPATRIPEIAEAMREAATFHAPFEITLAGLGCFPNLRRPRVVWVGVGGDIAALRSLQRSVEERLDALGYPPEKRDFSPHLTLARIQRSAKDSDIAALGQAVQKTTLGEISRLYVQHIHLIRSDLQPSGAIYTELAGAELRGGKPV